MAISIKEMIIAELDKVPETRLSEVLDFVKAKEFPTEEPRYKHFQFLVGSVPKEELDLMERDLEEACRRSRENMPEGATFDDLKFLIGSISKEDLDIMEKVIEEDCRQINYESW